MVRTALVNPKVTKVDLGQLTLAVAAVVVVRLETVILLPEVVAGLPFPV